MDAFNQDVMLDSIAVWKREQMQATIAKVEAREQRRTCRPKKVQEFRKLWKHRTSNRLCVDCGRELKLIDIERCRICTPIHAKIAREKTMKLHKRVMVVQAAHADLCSAVIDIVEKHDLTYWELIQCINLVQASWIKNGIQNERHPDDPEKPGGVA